MIKSILTAVVFVFMTVLLTAAEHGGADAAAHAVEEHGLPAAAPQFQIGPLVFTNSMLVTWMVAAGLIVISQVAMRRAQLIPAGLQNFIEWLVESLHGFLEGILGAELIKKSFWFFATLFIFILFTNWFGLIPGVGTIGYGHVNAQGHFHVSEPLLRGGNADLNMTLAMSLTFFVLWTVWSLQALGAGGFLKHIFAGGGGGSGIAAIAMMGIFFFVGVIEVISIAFRPVSLSFRLFGNIFAGENILESMMTLVPWLGWLLPLPFYFLELLVGLVQALVFTLLTSVFTALMAAHHADHGGGHDKAHAHGHAAHQH
ncbi:MAG: ATP synthase F0 subunit A [Pedosphaera sp.]|nr:ATP synthase F0 subunit A [Pedosphaera sp.]